MYTARQHTGGLGQSPSHGVSVGKDLGRKRYLDLDVSHFGCGADDRSPHQSRENVLREIRAGISTLHKLNDTQTESYEKYYNDWNWIIYK